MRRGAAGRLAHRVQKAALGMVLRQSERAFEMLVCRWGGLVQSNRDWLDRCALPEFYSLLVGCDSSCVAYGTQRGEWGGVFADPRQEVLVEVGREESATERRGILAELMLTQHAHSCSKSNTLRQKLMQKVTVL
jgi:hypothetical protein